MPSLALGNSAVWSADSERVDIAPFVEILEEKAGPLTLDDVRRLDIDEWQKNGSGSISLGYSDKVYWFRFQVTSASAAFESLYLEIAYPVLDHIELYMFEEGRLLESRELGDQKPFDQRLVHHRNFLVPLTLTPGYARTIYLRVDTTSSVQVPLILWDRNKFFAAEQSAAIFEGMYFGLVLAMILYNLFVYRAVRERSFLYYVGYITTMPLFLASLHGVSFQYLWPDATWWNDRAIIVFLNLTVLFGGAFTVRFLNVRSHNHPMLNRAMASLMVMAFGLALAGVVLPYSYMIRPTIFVACFGCSIMLLTGVMRGLKQEPAAKYYVVAWFFMVLGGIVLALNKFTLLPSNLLTVNAAQIGSAIGVILLSMALADRLNREKARTLEVQREANTLLEQRVQERTHDLESHNERLMEVSAKDALTGLKNRGYFDRAFKSSVVKAFRFRQTLSLLILDIDHFKKFNDTYGHLVGDDCLQMVANCIGEYVTRTQDLAARYGGEEFVVLLPDTPEEGALRVAEKIRKSIEETEFRVSDEMLHLTVSVGVCSLCPARADATKDVFLKADEALYDAKAQGRNRVVSSNESRPSGFTL